MKIKTTRNGNSIVPIHVGHLVIPTTERKYVIIDTISIELTKKDLTPMTGLIKHFIKSVNYTETKNKADRLLTSGIAMVLVNEFPHILYDKIKSDFKDYFNRCEMFKIAMMDFFDIKEFKMIIHLDCLEELRHVSVE